MKVLTVRSSHKNNNSKKKQSQFSIIFILASQYRSHSLLLSGAVHFNFLILFVWKFFTDIIILNPCSIVTYVQLLHVHFTYEQMNVYKTKQFILVSIIRSHGNDYFQSYNVLQC